MLKLWKVKNTGSTTVFVGLRPALYRMIWKPLKQNLSALSCTVLEIKNWSFCKSRAVLPIKSKVSNFRYFLTVLNVLMPEDVKTKRWASAVTLDSLNIKLLIIAQKIYRAYLVMFLLLGNTDVPECKLLFFDSKPNISKPVRKFVIIWRG